MRYVFVVPATDGTIDLGALGLDFRNEAYKSNQVSFAFYNSAQQSSTPGLYINPSSPVFNVTGTITLQAKATQNAIWESVPNGTAMDMSSPILIQWEGVTNFLQTTQGGISGCNYIEYTLDLF